MSFFLDLYIPRGWYKLYQRDWSSCWNSLFHLVLLIIGVDQCCRHSAHCHNGLASTLFRDLVHRVHWWRTDFNVFQALYHIRRCRRGRQHGMTRVLLMATQYLQQVPAPVYIASIILNMRFCFYSNSMTTHSMHCMMRSIDLSEKTEVHMFYLLHLWYMLTSVIAFVVGNIHLKFNLLAYLYIF